MVTIANSIKSKSGAPDGPVPVVVTVVVTVVVKFPRENYIRR